MKYMLLLLSCIGLFTVGAQKKNIYLFHGQGSDHRIFSKLVIDSTKFDTVMINYPKMNRKTTLSQYAKLTSSQIDTLTPYALVGVSFGGMIVSEMVRFLDPKKAIIISSAQNKNEIPSRYKFMRVLPLHKLVPAFIYKQGAKIAQPIFEHDRKKEKEIFKGMLKDKKAYFFKGVTKMMIDWGYVEYSKKIVHIHGTNDNTLPIKKCKVDFVIEEGSHMMLLTRAKELNKLINSILSN